ncbi:MAG: DUF5702 domain-containing protein [Eubacteriales bacterium]|nr:DUF5702 domain-containing protein [Eubacteriales bacterium]
MLQGNRRLSGAISIFLALVFTLCASLILASVETARSKGARTYLTIAADSAACSLFSQYHLELFEDYRILGLEEYSEDEIKDEMLSFINPYMSLPVRNWYALSTDKNGIRITDSVRMTENGGRPFIENVTEYMKLGVIKGLLSENEAAELITQILDARGVGDAADDFSLSFKEVNRLEKVLLNLEDEIDKSTKGINEAVSAVESYNYTAFCRASSKADRALSEIPGLTENFYSAADSLRARLETTRAELGNKLAGGEISAESYELLLSEIESFDRYTEKNGEVRNEIGDLPEKADKLKEKLYQLREEAEAAEDYVNSWVPGEILVGYTVPKTEGEKPMPIYEEETLDIGGVWRTAVGMCAGLKPIEVSFKSGIKNPEKKSALESVNNLLNGELLELMLPSGKRISKEAINLSEAPSKTGSSECEINIIENILMSEYVLMFLKFYDDEKDLPLEAEYALYGKESDHANLSQAAADLVKLRTGMNLIFLLKNSAKRHEAEAMATTITGLAAGTPLGLIMTFFIISVWALAQAVLDVRDLLDGERVQLMHDERSFYLTAEGILSIGTQLKKKRDESLKGLNYREYLRILLLINMKSQLCMRIMDILQLNLREKQEDFLMARLYTKIDFVIEAESTHVFYGSNKYRFNTVTSYGY